MNEMLAPVVARVLLRYAGGALIGWGATDALASDPDIVSIAALGVGALMGAASELWMTLARRYGWSR